MNCVKWAATKTKPTCVKVLPKWNGVKCDAVMCGTDDVCGWLNRERNACGVWPKALINVAHGGMDIWAWAIDLCRSAFIQMNDSFKNGGSFFALASNGIYLPFSRFGHTPTVSTPTQIQQKYRIAGCLIRFLQQRSNRFLLDTCVSARGPQSLWIPFQNN